MKINFIAHNRKKTVFVCQLSDTVLKVIKCLRTGIKKQVLGVEVEKLPPGIDDKNISVRLGILLKKLSYNNDPFIIVLARQNVTCRYLKVPTHIPAEIEKIVGLQASRYLPYPSEELVTGFEVVSVDKTGYSDINAIIVHKNVVERLLNIAAASNIRKPSLILSSFGLCNFAYYFNPKETSPIMAIDLDKNFVEIVVVSCGKMFFSRSFQMPEQEDKWQNVFAEEFNKSKSAYFKEVGGSEPVKYIVSGTKDSIFAVSGYLKEALNLNVQQISNIDIPAQPALINDLSLMGISLSSLVGLGINEIPQSINLLPKALKDKARKALELSDRIKLTLGILAIVFIFSLGLAKNINNKTIYLQKLKAELAKISNEAKPLEEIDKRFKLLEGRSRIKMSSLDLLYELSQNLPESVNLLSFTYEEGNQAVLRGQSKDLNSVFNFMNKLEKAPVFKQFNIKLRYVTQKKLQSGDVVDFEIICAKY
ncbi:MAG: PilN domain-containing protein [Candidatus Omnitrophica bacterium]|nr:PilN domain-containing protein [Candidatus Omnitrophota bacterium]